MPATGEVPLPPFWGTWKGMVVKAIAVDGAKTWPEVRGLTLLPAENLNIALRELFEKGLIEKSGDGVYTVTPALAGDYKRHSEGQQEIKVASEVQPPMALS